ncbi:MAG: iron-containing alcohol dehydrogenase [Pirellulaceae bacterium]
MPRIVFGRGSFTRVGELCTGLGRAAMVVTNGGEPGDGGPVDQLSGLLSEAGLRSVVWRQRGEPQVEEIDQSLELARRESCDVVVGLGGGSAIDAAKAVAGLLANGGSPLDYMEVVGKGQPITQPSVPWIAVPTTAGTGAEVTRNAVLGCREPHFKASLRSSHLLATIALVDAELGLNVPADISARTGMDALCQLIESYTSQRAHPMTDGLALEGMALAARSLPRVVADGQNLDAREDMALAALLSGLALANVGLGAVHGFAAPMGAHLTVPHGAVCAALLPHVMEANVAALQDETCDHPWLIRYARIGQTLTGRADLPATIAIDEGIRFTANLVEQLQIPRLSKFGLTADQIPELVDLAKKASSMRYNPVDLSDASLRDILTKAM